MPPAISMEGTELKQEPAVNSFEAAQPQTQTQQSQQQFIHQLPPSADETSNNENEEELLMLT